MRHYLFILVLLVISCQKKQEKVDHKLLNKRVTFGKNKAINKANIILDNKIYVWDLWEPVSYEKNIDWEIDPYDDGTWVLYFHSLRMVGVLARAYELTENSVYLSKSVEITRSWYDNYVHNKKRWGKNKFAWGDHTVTNRYLNLSHLYFIGYDVLEKKDKQLINRIILEQIEWMANDENYVDGNNHSIMLNMALLQAAVTSNHKLSKKWYDKANFRMAKVISNEITQEGVCIENSPGYHIFVLKLIDKIIKFHKDFKLTIPKAYMQDYEMMAEHLAYIAKPDRKLPNLGDTDNSNTGLRYNQFKNQYLDFIDSASKKGAKPDKTDVVYPISGYGIFRQAWGDSLSYEKMTQLVFTNTNISYVHKQGDNLSFQLYSNQEDLFVDSGHWGYQKNDTTKYLETTLAHNSITIDNTNYDYRKVPLLTSAEIYDYKTLDDYAYLRASFKPDSITTYKRDIVYIKPNVFILFDRVSSEKAFEKFQQIFNLSDTFKELNKSKEEYLLSFENNIIVIKHFNSEVRLNTYKADKSMRGLMVKKAMRTRKGTQIEFVKEVKSNKVSLITILEIQNSFYENSVKVDDIQIQQNELDLSISYQDISIKL